MAARAFDHLSQELRIALFREDSEAFVLAEKALADALEAAEEPEPDINDILRNLR